MILKLKMGSKEGYVFENNMFEHLKKSFGKNYECIDEREIKNKFGTPSSGIDIMISKNKCFVFIQVKNTASKSDIKDVNHFIHSGNRILMKYEINLKSKQALFLWCSKVGLTSNGLDSITETNYKLVTNQNETLIKNEMSNSINDFFNVTKFEKIKNNISNLVSKNDNNQTTNHSSFSKKIFYVITILLVFFVIFGLLNYFEILDIFMRKRKKTGLFSLFQ